MSRPRLSLASLLERFPALAHISAAAEARRRVPVMLQLTMLDCGATCLAMVLAYFGKYVQFEELRECIGVNRDGASAKAILDCARRYGLRARGISIDIDDLVHLPKGSILHWEFNHFVVFERLQGDHVILLDPAVGRRRVPLEEVQTALTGIALLFERAADFQAGRSGRETVWKALLGALYEDRRWVRVIATSTMMQIFALSMPVLMGTVVDKVVPRGDSHLLVVLSLGLLGVVAFNAVAALIRAHLLLEFRTTMDVRMSVTLIEHLVSLPMGFFAKRPMGDLMMRLNGSAAVRDILTASTLSALVDGTMVCAYLLVLLLVAPGFGLLAFGLGCVQVLVFVLARPRLQTLSAEQLNVQTRTQAFQSEMLAGMESLKVMGAEGIALSRWTSYFVDAANVSIARGRMSAVVEAMMSSLRLTSPLVTLIVGTLLVLHEGVSIGAMLAMQALAVGFLSPLTNMMNAADQLLLLRSYLERMDDVFAAAPEQDETKVITPTERLSGRVSLERVSFRYGEHSPFVVKDVSVELERGQFVAIVGPSGSGKSTLASLLLALHRPTSGRILYDGIDLAALDVRAVRRQLGVVLQKPYVFGDSIRRNIAMADPDLPLECVVEAARAAQIHSDIAAMPMGYETLVSDGGNSLSGGQRQRIALARALATRPAILLLDEATSALDAETEARVQSTVSELGCTRIVIAHRLSTIVEADLILVMKDGQIVARGTHDELLAQRGDYYQLVMAQLAESRTSRRLERELEQLEG